MKLMKLSTLLGLLPYTRAAKIYAAGSGENMLAQPATVAEIIALSGKPKPHVLYLGTATYDAGDAQSDQTGQFTKQGCTVDTLPIAVNNSTPAVMQSKFAAADIVLVSGGNTLYAVNRWRALGVDQLIKQAMDRDTVLCGGSAGGIVWFDGGHSDSMDPTSYKNPPGPLLSSTMSPEELSNWAYIRVPGTGVLPGFFCPHYDIIESNGVLRSTDFTTLLQRHSGETGIGVDNWAALSIDGETYTVISRANHTGSVGPNGQWTPGPAGGGPPGLPGAWTMQIDPKTGLLQRHLVPKTGKVGDLFQVARWIVEDNQCGVAANQNPADGKPPGLTVVKH